MSLYQHSAPQSYGHSHPYPPQPPRNYFQHHPQPPMPAHPYAPPPLSVQAPDPSTFRRDYAAHLSELTMNSRPIIQNLSMMAQNFTRYSDIVAECLQAHIRRVSTSFPLLRTLATSFPRSPLLPSPFQISSRHGRIGVQLFDATQLHTVQK